MISRRNIRVKVMQAIYAAELQRNEDEGYFLENAREQYVSLLENFQKTVYFFISFWINIFLYENRVVTKAKSHPPAFAERPFFQTFLKTAIACEAIKNTRDVINYDWMNKIFSQICTQLHEHKIYNTFLNTESSLSEIELLQLLWEELIERSEYWKNYIEEYIPQADADDGILRSLIPTIFSLSHASRSVEISIVPQDKKDFGNKLLETTIEKSEHIKSLLDSYLKNWDANRLGRIDYILLQLATAELLFFDDITPNITINEYVDIAKMYSGPKAGLFINGIIDAIHKNQCTDA